MSFQISPGVTVKETDLTNIIPAVATSIGAMAGLFRWGPVGDVELITSEAELAEKFGGPVNDSAYSAHNKYFFTAASFLKYANALNVVRGSSSDSPATLFNADSLGTGNVLINNLTAYEQTTSFSSNGAFLAKYPGELGNSLQVLAWDASSVLNVVADISERDGLTPVDGDYVYVTDSDGSGNPNAYVYTGSPAAWVESPKAKFKHEALESQFDSHPVGNEVHILVIDEDGEFTGSPGTILEKWEYLSTVVGDKTETGANNYFATVLANGSSYIYAGDITSFGVAADAYDPEGISLVGGGDVDEESWATEEISSYYDLFSDAETLDVNIIIGGETNTTLANHLIGIAESRRDCVVTLSPEIADSVNNINAVEDVISWANTLTSSSYAVLDSAAVYQYDKYNDIYIWIPASGHIAGLMAHTDNVADPWWSPAGYNRGQIRGVTKIAYTPRKAERDALYKNKVNPLVSFPGQGTVLYGDKTALSRPSAFDRINVRRLFLVLEKAISTASKYLLFEFNDEFTRAQFRNMTEPFLRDVQGRRGIYDFEVVADETNNTPEVIDSNEFRGDIYIKPARSINYITLNFVATRSGVEFSEIVGRNS